LCLTADLDWASEWAVQTFLDFAAEFGVRPTVFATHRSAALDRALASGAAEVGAHPNFLDGSTHGSGVEAVVEHVCALYPEARVFRAHAFRDDTYITDAFARRGFTHDSNIGLYLQPRLGPLEHHSGLVRFPVFWEDDIHFRNSGDWCVDHWIDAFLTPGLKILNVHPFMFAVNATSVAHYQSQKRHIPTLGPADLAEAGHRGDGVQTFLRSLFTALTGRGVSFSTLGELHRQHAQRPRAATVAGIVEGRQALHREEDVQHYASMTDAEKQEFVRREFENRNPTDPYATSRDYNMRELEIDALGRELTEPGPVLDLGCGNGYTLISLATRLRDWPMTGVDFSSSLVDGARALAAARQSDLLSVPAFVHADALEYLAAVPEGSVRYVITERFLQNLPRRERQIDAIRAIARVLAPGGRLLMCEGSEDGFERLNDLRAAVGLDRVPATSRENVSAVRFRDDDIERELEAIGLTVERKAGFSLFFTIARVLHPLLVAPAAPRFDAPINDLARLLQTHVPAAPGYGNAALWVCRK
jgi:ubiquinone/menaquinone biosynthesis C-methylase UbiE